MNFLNPRKICYLLSIKKIKNEKLTFIIGFLRTRADFKDPKITKAPLLFEILAQATACKREVRFLRLTHLLFSPAQHQIQASPSPSSISSHFPAVFF